VPTEKVTGAIEVYPAATLKAHGLPSRGYKSRNGSRDARAEIVNALSKRMTLSTDSDVLLSNDDALDAAVCVLAGLDFLEGAVHNPGEDLDVAEREGWIWFRA
jgi:hypothetical protein